MIKAKVARILNSQEIAITAGSDQGVRIGMLFNVLDPKGEDIIDPDTGIVLGSLERSKVRVKIIQVQEKMSVGSTYRKKRINIGGLGLGIGSLSQSFMPPKWVEEYETLKTKEKTWEDLSESESYVKTGDPVVEYIPTTADEINND